MPWRNIVIIEAKNGGRRMNIQKIIVLTGLVCLTAFLGYRYVTADPPGYCSAQKRYITDAELIQSALQLREGEIAHYGGMDAYEKDFISLNRHPEEAGRDFDIKDPNCCKVYRGKSAVKNECTIDDYPLCVRLHFPPLKVGEFFITKYYKYYEREGRRYLFDNCGKLQENY